MRENGKVKTLDELAEVLGTLRAGKKVVHCHGVFDLLHIGHIRHFEEARALGDILVVTLTPDEFVNKGPHRPVFPQELRAEAIAGLRCVDHVAVNRWPTAKETIELLRPDVFAKGSEYRDAGKDRTGAISVEEEAVRSVGGKLVLTEDLCFSSSNLLNRHLPVFSTEAVDYLCRFSSRTSAEDVLARLEDCRSLKVLVVGEAIVDEYQYCEAVGKSGKEPMLTVELLSTERFAGGILAVANHLASFCGEVSVVTFLGSRDTQEDFIRGKLREGIAPRFLYRKDSPTIVKRRFIENYFFTKLLEVNELNERFDPEDDHQLCRTLETLLPEFDLTVVVDYGHGMIGEEAVGLLCREARFLAVNAQSSPRNFGYHTISKYPRADYICIAENEIRLEARHRRGGLEEITLEVARDLRCPRIIVTRGARGCLVYEADEGFSEIPSFATRVVDRLGAGEAFFAATAPCVARGAPMEVVGFIGNAAGAQAVATVGNRKPIERVPLFRHIECMLK